MNKILSLLRSDMKNILRDPILAFVILTPFIAALASRWGLPYLTDLLETHLSFDLTAYYVLIASILIMTTPMMFGFVTGFLLLDERDEQILNFIAITPLSKKGYLLYRFTFPLAASFVLSIIVLLISNLVQFELFKIIPISFLAALQAPMLALILAAFASNKVEGLALFKGVNMMYAVGPVGGYLISAKWHLLLGVFPPYWVTRAFMASYQNPVQYSLYIICGLIVHGVVMALLWGKFRAKVD